MKITGYGDSLSITLRSGRDIGSILKGILPGDSVRAGIVAREGNIALLDIAGKRIRAEFTSGIPAENVITLILTEKKADTAVFRLAGRETGPDLQEFMKSAFLITDKVPDRGLMAELARFLSRGSPDLYSINLFLSGLKKDREKENRLSDLVNRLILRNVPAHVLNELILMAALRLPSPLFTAFMYFMEKGGKKGGITSSDQDAEKLSEAIAGLPADEELYADIMELVAGGDNSSETYGGFPFPDNGRFTRLNYIANEDSLFLDFTLSALGRICVLVRSGKNNVSINIGSDNAGSLEALEEQVRELRSSLEKNGITDAAVSFFSIKKMIDKLQTLCADFNSGNAIDVKI